MKKPFVHLRVHTEYSLLDSAARIEQLVKRAKELHMSALAITDQGTMSGVIPFYKACRREGIKSIIGCEVLVRNQERVSTHQIKTYPLLLLAQNQEGYQNLLRLLTEAHACHHRGIPCIHKGRLKRYTNGLIAMSGGLQGEITRAILANQQIEGKELVYQYIDLFGRDNFFLELEENHKQEQQRVNRQLITWSKEFGIGLVATNNIRYIHKEDLEAYLCLSSIRTGSLYTDARQENRGNTFYFKTQEEMNSLFAEVPDAIENTIKIAERCNVEFSFEEKLLPVFQVPTTFTSKTYLEKMCRDGVAKRYSSVTDEVKTRLEYELGVIHQMGLEDYFLVVNDLVQHARQKGIAVGPGRGSAAGSLVCYVLGITAIDPIRYRLFFERFLNPERVSLPDIDLDFSDERREEMIQYAKEKYGDDHVAQIVTFGTLTPRAAIRDIGRVLDISYAKVDQVAKLISSTSRSLAAAVREEPMLKELAEDPEIRTLLKMVQKIEGLPRHISTHAAGVIISGEPLTNYVPLQEGSAEIPLTDYPMEVLEEIGLLKIDFLGLRNLSVIERAKEIIKEMEGKTISFPNYDDSATYALLSSGNTMGVFQLESSGMRCVLQQVKPSHFEDLVAILALYRPGPMEQIPRFIRAKHGLEEVTYLHPDLEEILSTTYGVIVYQEQIIQIASKMAGFSLSKADSLRQAVSKKKEEVLRSQRDAFVLGCMAEGYDEKVGNQVYDLILRFANYGFNRSHSVAYGVLAYESAYLKANYPLAYMTALMTTVMGNQTKLAEYVGEVRRLRIRLLPPDVNKSGYSFTVDGNAIRFGLGAIKYLGAHVIHAILQAREEGPFQDMADLCRRIDLKLCNRKALESLIQCGATDGFAGHRALQVALLDEVMEEGMLQTKNQIRLFEKKIELLPNLDITPYSKDLRLEYELELLGVYVSGHPLDHYEIPEHATQLSELKALANNKRVQIAGRLTEVKGTRTKKGIEMAFGTMEDQTGRMEVVFFPKVYALFKCLLKEDSTLLVEGEVQTSERGTKLIATHVKELRKASNIKVYIRISDHHEAELVSLKEILLSYPGSIPVYLFYERTKKLVALSVKRYGIAPSDECVEKIKDVFGENAFYTKEIEAY